jgi:hypothetical protein
MSSRAKSPRVKLTADQKLQRALEKERTYRVDKKKFAQITLAYSKGIAAAVKLSIALQKAGVSMAFQWADGSRLTKSGLKTCITQMRKEVSKLSLYFAVSMRHKRTPGIPASFKGVYTPITVGPALQGFLQEAAADPALRDSIGQLQGVAQGYMMRNTLTKIFYLYANVKGLHTVQDAYGNIDASYVRADDRMNRWFGGSTPAQFFAVDERVMKKDKKASAKASEAAGRDTPVYVEKYKATKRAMELHPGGPINTYAAIRERPGRGAGQANEFRPERFQNWGFQLIAGLNYPSSSQVSAEERAEFLGASEAAQQRRAVMLADHELIGQWNARWKAQLAPERERAQAQRKAQAKAAKGGR